jgi:hypothetical protein
MNLPKMKEMVRTLCDPENQPHPWVGKPTELWKALFDAPVSFEQARLFKDGDKWCCLMGPNIQEGIAGFGATQDEAISAFGEAVHKFAQEF